MLIKAFYTLLRLRMIRSSMYKFYCFIWFSSFKMIFKILFQYLFIIFLEFPFIEQNFQCFCSSIRVFTPNHKYFSVLWEMIFADIRYLYSLQLKTIEILTKSNCTLTSGFSAKTEHTDVLNLCFLTLNLKRTYIIAFSFFITILLIFSHE